MKCIILILTSIVSISSAVLADDETYNTSLLFDQENRIALGGGSGGWYFTPHIGYNLIPNTSTQGFTVKFSGGLALGGGVGCTLQNDIAVQFDFGYVRNDVDTINNTATGVGASPNIEFTQIPLIASFIWSPSSQPDLKPYFLLGAGAIRGNYDNNTFITSDEEWAFALRIGIGAKFDLSNSSSLIFGYQFTLAQYDDTIDNHTVRLGLSFDF